jgi:colanic acid/amylovoran biosynthesis glycosyltransferase
MAYLVSLFPCWSETFIAEELQHLLDDGFDVTIFSLRQAFEPHVHEIARGLLPRTLYADSYADLVRAQFHFLWRKPSIYLQHLGRAIKGSKGSPALLAKMVATFFLAVYFAQIVERRGVARIHAHWATFPASAAWVIGSLTGVPFSFTVHAHDLFLADNLLREKIKAANFVVTISEFNRQILQQQFAAEPGNVRVIHCGVDTRKFNPTRQSGGTTPRLLAVGRLVPIKGFDVLIEACRFLRADGVDFSCEIVGSGPLDEALKRQIVDSGLGEVVQMSGFAPQEEVSRKLGATSLFVLPCQETKNGDRDGIPVVLMEAMAMGVPVVSTTVSGVPELVENGISGTLVPPGDARRLADAIQAALSDRAKSARMADAGRRTVLDQFDVAKNAQRLGQYFMGHS